MARRASGEDRRAQIVAVALELLEDTPVDRLTTRQIAKRMGISQPALFRHFRTRDQILLGLMDTVHAQLGAIAERVLDTSAGPLARIDAVARSLLAHVDAHPGLPRLLFAPPGEGPLRTALTRLVSMQTSFVAELVREGQRRGELRGSVDPERAATLFVGLIQGLALRQQLFPGGPLEAQADSLLGLWLDGVRAREGDEPAAPAEPPDASEGRQLVALDVRPILEAGVDPLAAILSALDTVVPGGILTVSAPFRPAPLISLLSGRGHEVEARQVEGLSWTVDVVRDGGPIHDLDLPPPEPLERILEACADLEPGALYRARVPRFPRLLLPRLALRRFSYETHEREDGRTLVVVGTET